MLESKTNGENSSSDANDADKDSDNKSESSKKAMDLTNDDNMNDSDDDVMIVEVRACVFGCSTCVIFDNECLSGGVLGSRSWC